MLIFSILLSLFFLVWAFFLTSTAYSLSQLGETRFLEIKKKYSKRFFYAPLHFSIFKKRSLDLLIFSASLGGNIARLGYAVMLIIGVLSIQEPQWHEPILFIFIFLFLFLLISDVAPRLWSIRIPERSLVFSLPFSSFFLYLSFPISFIFIKLAEVSTHKGQRNDQIDEMRDTVVQILQSANVKGKLNSSDKMLIESVIKFKDRIVREVMVPRVNLFSLPAEMTIRNAAKELVQEGYSRTPVYRENIDNIVGVLMFKDILELYMACAEGKKDAALLDSTIETIIKGVFYTPETKKVSHLLQEFRAKQMHMAIVVDEYGGTEGVVTMEDILEEIVGEIADEYDLDEELLYTTHPTGSSWIVDARMTILDAEDIFGIHIPQEGDYDTIGGYIFHKMGSIPEKGLKIHHEDFDLEILNSSERSVEKVRITPRKLEKDLS